jgi:glycosyltransferase involved in cell wall biosynthesis
MKPTISLIVATYNWPEALKLCLLSIKRQTSLPIEVIIADDGSDMRTTTLIAEIQKNFPIPLVRTWHEDLGFRKSIILNKAIKKAVGSFLVQFEGVFFFEHIFL